MKALFAAAAAAARGNPGQLRDAARRAPAPPRCRPSRRGRQPPPSGSHRGEEAAGRLVAELLAHYGPPEPGGAPAQPLDAAAARAYFRDYFGGEMPERVALLAERSPPAFEGYAQLHRGVLRDGALEPKLAELLLCAVNAARVPDRVPRDPRQRGAQGRRDRRRARRRPIVSVIPVAGIAAWAATAGALGRDLTATAARRRARCRGRSSPGVTPASRSSLFGPSRSGSSAARGRIST